MTVPLPSRITLNISVCDAYDGLVRLLVDAQRFGWSLAELQATSRLDSSAEIRLVVAMPASAGQDAVAARLARHPSVTAVQVVPGG